MAKKKKKSNLGWKIFIGAGIACMLAVFGIVGYEYYMSRRAGFIKYEARGSIFSIFPKHNSSKVSLGSDLIICISIMGSYLKLLLDIVRAFNDFSLFKPFGRIEIEFSNPPLSVFWN